MFKEIIRKTNLLLYELSDTNSVLYQKSDPFFKEGDVEIERTIDRGWFSDGYREKAIFSPEKATFINLTRGEALQEKLAKREAEEKARKEEEEIKTKKEAKLNQIKEKIDSFKREYSWHSKTYKRFLTDYQDLEKEKETIRLEKLERELERIEWEVEEFKSKGFFLQILHDFNRS